MWFKKIHRFKKRHKKFPLNCLSPKRLVFTAYIYIVIQAKIYVKEYLNGTLFCQWIISIAIAKRQAAIRIEIRNSIYPSKLTPSSVCRPYECLMAHDRSFSADLQSYYGRSMVDRPRDDATANITTTTSPWRTTIPRYRRSTWSLQRTCLAAISLVLMSTEVM